MRLGISWIFAGVFASAGTLAGAVEPEKAPKQALVLRVWAEPQDEAAGAYGIYRSEKMAMFRKKFPRINPVPAGGLFFGGNEYNIMMEVLPLMQIAGGVQPDAMHLRPWNCHSYVRQRLLYPLDKHLEKALGVAIEDGHLLGRDEYFQRLKESALYESHMALRAPRQLWTAMRRQCPYGQQCSYCRRHGLKAAEKHYHIWAIPVNVYVRAVVYRRDLFREAGLPDRAPETLDEFIDFARRLTDPDEREFGLRIDLQDIGATARFVMQCLGGRIAEQDEEGNWGCAYDSQKAVEACYFVSRLFYEPYTNRKGMELTSVVFPGESPIAKERPPWRGGIAQIGMFLEPFDQKFFWYWRSPSQFGLGATPKGPGGKRGEGGTMGARLLGIFAGLEDDQDKIDAAWEWIWFYDGLESRRMFARVFVEHGKAQYVQPRLLKEAGFASYVRQVPKQWVEANDQSFRTNSVPMIGENTQMILKSFRDAMDQIWTSSDVQRAIAGRNEDLAKQLIREILKQRVRLTNEQILKMLTPEQEKFRWRVSVATAVAIFVIFVLVFRRVFKTFIASQVVEANRPRGMWQFSRYKWAYILLIPAVGSIALWAYYPLARGTVMAFQDYRIRGVSSWVGLENFTTVLFDEGFWYAVWVSFKYILMYALFGFTAPIILAFLLTEIPKGKVLFRTLYYLPAVLSGIVVMFLWKGFYGQYGMINQVLNSFIALLNMIPGVAIEELHKAWLQDPNFALFFVLLPVIWIGAGPGCLIYLAALKTIPEELYEAADIDGAGILQKAFHVSIPGIKGLIIINFIGVMVAQMKGGSEFVLAMTQGGPHTPYGQTEVVGLYIYWQAFGFLKFGTAAAMAWVLGSMLVGFTVLQMQRLSRMEFKTSAGIK